MSSRLAELKRIHGPRLRSSLGVPMIGGAINQAKPLRSLGLGCHRTQAREFNQYYRENGITGAHHDKDGVCVLESRQARNKVLKLRGLRDNDAGYGDWAGEK